MWDCPPIRQGQTARLQPEGLNVQSLARLCKENAREGLRACGKLGIGPPQPGRTALFQWRRNGFGATHERA